MNEWLKDDEYKITIGAGVFAMVIVLATAITLIRASFQAIRTATANPVTSLRSE